MLSHVKEMYECNDCLHKLWLWYIPVDCDLHGGLNHEEMLILVITETSYFYI